MRELQNEFEQLGIHIPEILLPCHGTNMPKWSVIACDQFTSQPQYWGQTKKLVGSSPSTLNLVLPEIYLEKEDVESRISKINNTMKSYLDKEILTSHENCLIYVERQTRTGRIRKGLLAAVDLECYDYLPTSKSLIRATEGTVIERLPPRMKIRENAPLECPHIMLLLDNPNKTVIEPLSLKKELFEEAYNFELMQSGGNISGYIIKDKQTITNICSALQNLVDPDFFAQKYGLSKKTSPLLFAVGDGNHSLASAKAHWEKIKSSLSDDESCEHPARYALVEIVNVHDDSLVFEPIHRIVTNISPSTLFEKIADASGLKHSVDVSYFDSKQEMDTGYEAMKAEGKNHCIPFITKDGYGIMSVSNPSHNLETGTLQSLLDMVLTNEDEIKIDYIHGEDALFDLAQLPGCTGFLLPPMNKHDLFKTVILDGVLPRKTFSMGHAEEKRYYLECRKIR
jgi:uncharacterized protein (DUF1015 family)